MSVPISNVTRRVVFAPSGVGPYAFTFEILAQTDIEVYKGDNLLTLTTDYTVTINTNGTGSVTLVATAGTDNITIIGARTIQRTTDFVTGGDFFANTVNTEFDSLTIFAQQNAEGIERALRAPETDPTTIDMTLPRAADRANKYLAFDANGDPAPGDTAQEIADVAANIANINIVKGQITPVNNIATVAGAAANIATVAGIAANVTTVAGISGNVTTVAGISADVTAVAGDATDIGTVAGLSTEIAALGPIAADITTVAGIDSDVTAVAADATDIGAVASNIANVNTVAGISADVTTVAADGTDIGTVAGIAANVTTVAGIAANVTTVAGISANVTTVAGISADVTTVANNVADVTNFSDVYLGPKSSDPSVRNDSSALQAGDLYFNTVADEMRVYTGTAWKAAGSAVNGTTTRQTFTATAGQTTFTITGGYDSGFADVYVNGVKMVNGVDVNVSSGTDVVLAVGAAAGDDVDVVAYGAFSVANHYTKAESDIGFVGKDSATGAALMPVGTTAQRPASPQEGMFRQNSTTGEPEWYDTARSQWIAFGDRTYDIDMFAWGGGGGGAGGGGGGGGAATGTLLVSRLDQLAIVVGGGGLHRPASSNAGSAVVGGGGIAGVLGFGGQGGGYSGIFLDSASQANAMLIAGGGGGAAWEAAAGGAGGGTNGVAGGNGLSAGGGGGTQSAGGTSVSQAGSALQGGSPGSHSDSGGGGGGGGGYFGGGGGGNDNPGSGGGGGSGYFNSTFVTSATLSAGSGVTPGDSSNALRGTAGQGGASGTGNGNAGVVVIRYAGAQKGTGGTVTSSGGYTIHTFTSSGTFTA